MEVVLHDGEPPLDQPVTATIDSLRTDKITDLTTLPLVSYRKYYGAG
jgi:hypothetical protein